MDYYIKKGRGSIIAHTRVVPKQPVVEQVRKEEPKEVIKINLEVDENATTPKKEKKEKNYFPVKRQKEKEKNIRLLRGK